MMYSLLLGVSVPVYTVDSPFGYPTYHSGQQTITICIQDGTGVAFGKDLHSCESILKLNEEMSVCPSLRLAILGGEVGISTNLANGWLATMTSCRKSCSALRNAVPPFLLPNSAAVGQGPSAMAMSLGKWGNFRPLDLAYTLWLWLT